MKRKQLKLSKQTLRNLTKDRAALVAAGGRLNCTNPTSMPLVMGCLAISIESTGCP